MNDVIIFAGNAIGSVLTLAEEIKLSYKVRITVIGLKSGKNVISIFKTSIFIDEVVIVDYTSNENFYDQMNTWYQNTIFTKKPVVYFTTDTSCYLINLYRDRFEEKFELILPSSEIINTYTRKGEAEIAAERNGLICPKSIVINNNDDILNVISEFDFPVIIKPTASYSENKAPFKTRRLSSEEFVEVQCDLLQQGYQVICQEFIPGGDNKAYFYIFNRDKNGKIHYVLGRKVLQNPPQAGIMAKGIVEENEELSIICAEFLEKINYTGIGGIEFKKYNGKYYFIEMSTRLEGFFKIGCLAGVPLGKIAYESICRIGQIKNYKAMKGAEYNDLFNTISAYMRGNRYVVLLKELCAAILLKRHTLNIYSKHDPKPFFKMLKFYIK